jgi:hypothetical protein
MNTASIHRFRNAVALYIGNGQTVYVSAQVSRKIAKALNACARDIVARDFTESKFQTVDIEWESKK